MDNDIIDRLVEPFYDTSPEAVAQERCAVVFAENDANHRMVEVPNRHETPDKQYRVSKTDVQALRNDGELVLAVVHTHPARRVPPIRNRHAGVPQEPSKEDWEGLPDGLLGIVVHPYSKSWTLFDNKVGVLAFRDGRK